MTFSPSSTDNEAEAERRGPWRIIAIVAILAILIAGAVVAVVMWDDWAPSATSTPSTPSEPPLRGSAINDTTVLPGTAEGFDGARIDIDDFGCNLSEGRWVVAGSVTNPLQESVSYRIYTSFVASDRQTLGILQVDADDVEAGETREWGGSIDISEPGVTCVLRVERTTSGS